MRQLVVRILRTLSISEIKSVTSATQALDLLSKGYQADLIIADYDMQPMDGVEFTRRLRRGEGEIDPRLPVLMVSGISELERVRQDRKSVGKGRSAYGRVAPGGRRNIKQNKNRQSMLTTLR